MSSVRLFLILAVVHALLACNQSDQQTAGEMTVLNGRTMGTVWSVKLFRERKMSLEETRAITHRLDILLKDINKTMSTWDPDSTLSRLNANKSTAPISLDPELQNVMAAAVDIGKRTAEALDISILPLVNAWGFGPAGRPEHVPGKKEIDTLRLICGLDRFHLDFKNNTLTKYDAQIAFDLSAIAKGYAVDRLAEILIDLTFFNFMIDIGGEVKCYGTNARNIPWQIGIERPDTVNPSAELVVSLSGKAMATSGDYRNYYVKEKRRFSHTIDPRTGFPVTHNLASVSVIHDSCMMADGWATALNVLGPEAGPLLAEKEKLAVCFIIREKDGFRVKNTPLFNQFIEEN